MKMLLRNQILKTKTILTHYSISCLGGIVGMYSGFKINDILYHRKK